MDNKQIKELMARIKYKIECDKYHKDKNDKFLDGRISAYEDCIKMIENETIFKYED